MKERWTKEQANAWYAKQGWLRGCNFIGSDCANRIDQWQSYGREERMRTAEREMQLCEEIGFNTIRLIVEFDVWYQEHDAFMEALEQYVSMANRHGLSVMLVLAHEAQICRGETYVFKPLGEQKFALGYHQGRLPLSPEEAQKTPYHALERLETRDAYLKMVREIVGKYAQDSRILCWNVYNEPGIAIRERAVPLLDMLFEAVRSQDPMQPLAADVWRSVKDGRPSTLAEQRALDLSDVISFHSYTPYEHMVPQLEMLQAYGRPILMTEWLNRINHSDVRELYPLFYLEHVGCYCWGFVVGKTQTQEPWETLWDQYAKDPEHARYDFTKWQHDLFRPNLRPYDPGEIELIRAYNARASLREKK